jgi:hypothetical protein
MRVLAGYRYGTTQYRVLFGREPSTNPQHAGTVHSAIDAPARERIASHACQQIKSARTPAVHVVIDTCSERVN